MSSENHYQVLGVDRTADARAIKKAYFALIRRHTPESDPETFQRVRAAYEVLSDPEQKDRYDHAERGFSELDAVVAERLRAIEETAKEATPDAVLELLRALAADHPDVPVVRERLAFALMQANLHEQAVSELVWLAEREPENARWPFHRGVALGRMGDFARARPHLVRAVELDPLAVPARLALSEVLSELDRAKEGVAVLQEGVDLVEAESPGFYALTLRKAELLHRTGKQKAAESLMRELVDKARASGEDDKRRFVAGQIASLAAKLFAKNDVDAANGALAIAASAVPESPVERPYPVVTTLSAAALPARALEWLANLPTGPTTPTVVEAMWALPFFVTLGGMLAAFGAALAASAGKDPTLVAAGAAVGGLLLAEGLRRTIAMMSGPLRGFVTVHPLWVVRARGDAVSVYSLFSLVSTNGTHHHTNGVYTHTSIVLAFGGEKRHTTTVTIRNQGYAQAWLTYLWETRGRSLELLSEGFLEAEGGVDLLSPSEVERAGEPTTAAPAWRAWVPALVAAALLAPSLGWYASVRERAVGVAYALSSGGPLDVLKAARAAGARDVPGLDAYARAPYAEAKRALGASPLATVVDDVEASLSTCVTVRAGSRVHVASALSEAFFRGTAALGAGEILCASRADAPVTVDLDGEPTPGGGRWRWRVLVRGAPARELAVLSTTWSPAGEPTAAQQRELVAKALGALALPYSPRSSP